MKRIISMITAIVMTAAVTSCGKEKVEEGRTEYISIWSDCYNDGCIIGYDKTMYLDFETLEISPLCAVPNCTHSDSSCLAKQVTRIPIFYKDQVYFFYSNRGDVRETPDGKEFYIDSKLKKASLDSSQIEVVCEFTDCVPNIDYDGYVIHNNEVYFVGDDYNPQQDMYGNYSYGNAGGNHFLCSIDLDTGKYTNYGSIYDGEKVYEAANCSSGARILGVRNDKIYIRYSYLKEIPNRGEMPDITYIIFEFDLDAKELSESDMPSSCYMNDDIFTYFDEDTRGFHVLKDDKDRVVSLKEEIINGYPTVISIFNNKCFLLSGYVWFDLDDLVKHPMDRNDDYYIVAYYDGKYIARCGANSTDFAVLTEDDLYDLVKE